MQSYIVLVPKLFFLKLNSWSRTFLIMFNVEFSRELFAFWFTVLQLYVVHISFLQVTLVRWNEPYQKLASCDTSGIIFVWIKYEGRWSIELINDRSTPVICFSWSHDGRMALICYQVITWLLIMIYESRWRLDICYQVNGFHFFKQKQIELTLSVYEFEWQKN